MHDGAPPVDGDIPVVVPPPPLLGVIAIVMVQMAVQLLAMLHIYVYASGDVVWKRNEDDVEAVWLHMERECAEDKTRAGVLAQLSTADRFAGLYRGYGFMERPRSSLVCGAFLLGQFSQLLHILPVIWEYPIIFSAVVDVFVVIFTASAVQAVCLCDSEFPFKLCSGSYAAGFAVSLLVRAYFPSLAHVPYF